MKPTKSMSKIWAIIIVILATLMIPFRVAGTENSAPTITFLQRGGELLRQSSEFITNKNPNGYGAVKVTATDPDGDDIDFVEYKWDAFRYDVVNYKRTTWTTEKSTRTVTTYLLPAVGESTIPTGIHILFFRAGDIHGNVSNWKALPYYVVDELSASPDTTGPVLNTSSMPTGALDLNASKEIKIKFDDPESGIYYIAYAWKKPTEKLPTIDEYTKKYQPINGEVIANIPTEPGKYILYTYAANATFDNEIDAYTMSIRNDLEYEVVDRKELNEVKAQMGDLEEEDYTPASWARLIATLNMPEKNQTEIDAKVVAIREKMQPQTEENGEIKGNLVTISALDKAIKDAEKTYLEANYSETTWNKYATVLETSTEVRNSEDPTQKEVDVAKTNLENAITNLLKEVEASNAALAEAKANARNYVEGNYTAEVYKPLKDALAMNEATQKEVDAKTTAINSAIEAIKTATEASQAALAEAKTNAGNYAENNYTAEAYKPLKDALAKAETTQKEMAEKTVAINAAIEAVEANKTTTQTALETAKTNVGNYAENNYTTEAYKPLKDALAKAETTQKEMAEKVVAINAAIQEIETATEASQEALEEAKTNAGNYVESNYTVEVYKPLKDALAMNEATQKEVDAKTTAINSAIEALKTALKTSQEALAEAIKVANEKKEEDYSPESWTEFQEALGVALDLPESNQKQIEDKIVAINAAIDKLVDDYITDYKLNTAKLEGKVFASETEFKNNIEILAIKASGAEEPVEITVEPRLVYDNKSNDAQDILVTYFVNEQWKTEEVNATIKVGAFEVLFISGLDGSILDRKSAIDTGNGYKVESLPTAPTKPGYTFDGWFMGTIEFTEDTIISSDIVVMAKFTITHDHDYDYANGTWSWTNDGSSATLTATCKKDPNHKDVQKATITNVVTAPTCEADGYTTYTATVTVDGNNYTSKKVITDKDSALGHNYQATFNWSTDKSSATVTITCANDAEDTRTETATVTSEITKPATCTEAGERTYTATYEDYTDVETEVIPALQHNYQATFTLSDDKTTVAVVLTCSNDTSHKIEDTVNVTATVTKSATCTETGLVTYTASYEYENTTYPYEEADVVIPATGHNMTYHAPVESTDEHEGNVEYWSCSNCNNNFSDENGTEILENVVTKKVYTVTFYDEDGTTVLARVEKVEEGSDVTYPNGEPTKEGYIFKGWDTELTNITANTSIKAQWERIITDLKEAGAKVTLNYPNTTAVMDTENPEKVARYEVMYDGQEKPVQEVVKIGDTTLELNKDYTANIIYRKYDAKEPNPDDRWSDLPSGAPTENGIYRAYVTIEGMGAYKGKLNEVNARIDITVVNLSKAEVILTYDDAEQDASTGHYVVDYDGQEKPITVVVKIGDTTLDPERDYEAEIIYKKYDAKEPNPDDRWSVLPSGAPIENGIYRAYVTVKPKDANNTNYKGQMSKNERIDIERVGITKTDAKFVFEGEDVIAVEGKENHYETEYVEGKTRPATLPLVINGRTLIEGVDYDITDVVYKQYDYTTKTWPEEGTTNAPEKVGTHRIYATITGKGNYSGKLTNVTSRLDIKGDWEMDTNITLKAKEGTILSNVDTSEIKGGTIKWKNADKDTVLEAGKDYVVNATFAPTDSNYRSVAIKVTIIVVPEGKFPELAPIVITYAPDAKLSSIQWPTEDIYKNELKGTFEFAESVDKDKVIGNAGKTTEYPVIYNEDGYLPATGKISVTVIKADNAPKLPEEGYSATYNDLLSTIELPKGWAFDNKAEDATVGNVGTNTFNVTYTPDDETNYNTAKGTVEIHVGPATPSVTVKLSGRSGIDTLADVDVSPITTGTIRWIEPDTLLTGVGDKQYEAEFTPNNSNYKKAIIKITVTVLDVTGPTITVKQNPHEVEANKDGNYLDLAKTNYTAVDNISEQDEITFVRYEGTVNMGTVGTYEVYYFVKDGSGNETKSEMVTVKVVDNTAPTLKFKEDAENVTEDGTTMNMTLKYGVGYNENEVKAMMTPWDNTDIELEIERFYDDETTSFPSADKPGDYVMKYYVRDGVKSSNVLTVRIKVLEKAPNIMYGFEDEEFGDYTYELIQDLQEFHGDIKLLCQCDSEDKVVITYTSEDGVSETITYIPDMTLSNKGTYTVTTSKNGVQNKVTFTIN